MSPRIGTGDAEDSSSTSQTPAESSPSFAGMLELLEPLKEKLTEALAEVKTLRSQLFAAGYLTFDKLGADRLADEVDVLVRRKVIDSRSPAADALLDYREPPSSERSCRLASLEKECDELRREVKRLRPVEGATEL